MFVLRLETMYAKYEWMAALRAASAQAKAGKISHLFPEETVTGINSRFILPSHDQQA